MKFLLTCVDQLVHTPIEQEQPSGPKNFTSSLGFNSEFVSLQQKLDFLPEKMMEGISKLEMST